ncbi:hypothetical protein [Hymenobacter sp. AT01-02]|uniref:hypothetical protein n=1 Tax=Hymenobacter sp. AT01-02 TaxID=1571877 RepID=UPI0006E1A1A5|nr:hypothetical protein [Hymenobacter sp. AT01-02]
MAVLVTTVYWGGTLVAAACLMNVALLFTSCLLFAKQVGRRLLLRAALPLGGRLVAGYLAAALVWGALWW